MQCVYLRFGYFSFPAGDAANPTSQTIAGHMGFELGLQYRAVVLHGCDFVK